MNEAEPLRAVLGVVAWVVTLAQGPFWGWAAWRLARGEPLLEARWRRRVPWGPEGVVLAAVMVATSWAGVMAKPEEPAEAGDLMTLDGAARLALMAGLLVATQLALLASRYRLDSSDLGLPRSIGEATRDAGIGLVCCVAALGPVYLVQSIVVLVAELPSTHPTLKALLEAPTAEAVAAAVLTAVVVMPIVEELAFRVLLQGWLERLASPAAWWPVVVSSAVFAAAHAGQGWAPVPLFVLALALGRAYQRTHRVVPIAVAHVAFNALSIGVVLAAALARGEPAAAP